MYVCILCSAETNKLLGRTVGVQEIVLDKINWGSPAYHRGERGGIFMFIDQPEDRVTFVGHDYPL